MRCTGWPKNMSAEVRTLTFNRLSRTPMHGRIAPRLGGPRVHKRLQLTVLSSPLVLPPWGQQPWTHLTSIPLHVVALQALQLVLCTHPILLSNTQLARILYTSELRNSPERTPWTARTLWTGATAMDPRTLDDLAWKAVCSSEWTRQQWKCKCYSSKLRPSQARPPISLSTDTVMQLERFEARQTSPRFTVRGIASSG
jgi:hypothetical protein